MPLLEQLRRSHRTATYLGNRFLTVTIDHWPAAWSVVFLGGALFGRATVLTPWSPEVGPWLVRAAGLAPLLLGARRAAPAVWVLVATAAAVWSAERESVSRRTPHALAPAPTAPARARAWTGPALFRTSGYAARATADTWQAPACVLAVGVGSGTAPERGDGLLVRGVGPTPAPGAVIGGVLQVATPRTAPLAGAFDDRRYLSGRGLRWRAGPAVRGTAFTLFRAPTLGTRLSALRGDLQRRLARLLPPREARLAAAVLLGVRNADSRREVTAFTQLGLAHLFAVSGLHVGILAGFVVVLARTAGVGRPWLLAVLAPLVPAYMALTGAPGSVVRAGGMVLLLTTVAAVGRRPLPLRLAGLLFWGSAMWDPQRVLDVGALLSYAAAGGILAVSALTDGFAWTGSRRANLLLGGLGVSLAAQWATLPCVAEAFGRINVWSPLANLVIVPVFGVLVGLLAAALALDPLCGWVADSLAGSAWLLARAVTGAVTRSGLVAGGTVGLAPAAPPAVLGWLVGTLALAVLVRRRGRWLLGVPVVVTGGVLLFGPWARDLPPSVAPRVMVFDVGQGDAALVAFPDGWTGLVDTGDAPLAGAAAGAFARTVAPWCVRQGVDGFDAVVLSHGHRDHTGGAPEVVRRFPVDTWYAGGRSGTTVDHAGGRWWSGLAPVAILHRWRDWELRLINPQALPGRVRAENDRSLVVVLLREDRALMVLTGDLEAAGEKRLAAAGFVPRGVDVWKVGHHGSATSGSADFMAATRPRVVLISCGVANRHGHPSHGPYICDGDTARVLRTDLDGTITVDWGGDGTPRITTHRHRRTERLDTVPDPI